MKKILGLICIAASIALGVAMFKQQSNDSSGNRGNQLTRHSAPVVLLGLGLRLLLSGGGSGGSISLSLPKRSGNGGSPALRGGQNTFASNPAQIDLNFAHWLAANPRHIVFDSVLAGGGLLLLLIKWQAGVALLIATGIVIYRTRNDMRGKFYRGDVCPGVVLSAESGLVAVLADLKAATNIARPALKILKQPLGKIKAYALQDGMRVATVAEYYGNADQTTWKNFFPEVIPCSVHDAAENQRVLDSIPEEQWQALDQHLSQLPEPRPGLYRLWGNNLSADLSASVPWLQRKAVRIGLMVFAVLGGLIIFMQASVLWNERSREQRAQSLASQEHLSTTPTASPPASQSNLDLRGKIVTVTNRSGKVFADIKLIEANPHTLVYSHQGRQQRLPLISLPVEFLDSLEIPKDWAGYRAAANNFPGSASNDLTPAQPKPAAAPVAAPAGEAYKPGQKIYAQWAGRWIPGTVIEPFGIGMSYRVQLNDPRFRNSMVLSTNLLRPQ